MDDIVKKALEILSTRPSSEKANIGPQVHQIQAHNAHARGILDAFFTQEILPRLTALHMAGRLPNLALCPTWGQVEAGWQTASVDSKVLCDVEGVKRAMLEAVSNYEKGEHQGRLI